MKGLIVTADDFGAAVEVNEAIEIAHRDGLLTAASLMVSGEAATDAITRARKMPSLRVGLHLVLVEGKPILRPDDVPDLVDEGGNFRTDMARAGAAIFFRPKVRRQVADEIEAQFEAFHATGLPLDHVNAHKHFHLHPTVASLIIDIGRKFGVKAVRVPHEPSDVFAQIEPHTDTAMDVMVRPWVRLLQRRCRATGLLVPDNVFGLRWSGAMTAERLSALVDHLPDGLNEIYLHPATADNFRGAAAGYRYRDELAALTAPGIVERARQKMTRLGGFADFQVGR